MAMAWLAIAMLATTSSMSACRSESGDDEPKPTVARPAASVPYLGDNGLFLHSGAPILGASIDALTRTHGDRLVREDERSLVLTLAPAGPDVAAGSAPHLQLSAADDQVTAYWFSLEYRSIASGRDAVARALDRKLGGRGRPVRRGAHDCSAYPVPGMDDTPADDSTCAPEMFACERAEVAVCHSEAMNAITVFVEGAQPPTRAASAQAAVLEGRTWRARTRATLPENPREPSVTRLRDGRILLIGGIHWEPRTNDAIVYDPASDEVLVVPSPHARTRQHTATELADGTVLVAGGTPADVTRFHLSVALAQRFDPVKKRWLRAPPMTTARYGHSAYLLDDGRVLVFGGTRTGGEFLRSTEIYDPRRNRWVAGPELNQGRWQHADVRLRSGHILVAGSGEPGAEMTSEVFDPQRGTWSLSGTLNRRWFGHSMVLLGDGRAWLVGESYVDESASANPADKHPDKPAVQAPLIESELYDPDTSIWTLSARDTRSWMSFSVAVTEQGVLLAGGHRPVDPGRPSSKPPSKPPSKLSSKPSVKPPSKPSVKSADRPITDQPGKQVDTLLFAPHTEKFYVGPPLPATHAGDSPRMVRWGDDRVLLFSRNADTPIEL